VCSTSGQPATTTTRWGRAEFPHPIPSPPGLPAGTVSVKRAPARTNRPIFANSRRDGSRSPVKPVWMAGAWGLVARPTTPSTVCHVAGGVVPSMTLSQRSVAVPTAGSSRAFADGWWVGDCPSAEERCVAVSDGTPEGAGMGGWTIEVHEPTISAAATDPRPARVVMAPLDSCSGPAPHFRSCRREVPGTRQDEHVRTNASVRRCRWVSVPGGSGADVLGTTDDRRPRLGRGIWAREHHWSSGRSCVVGQRVDGGRSAGQRCGRHAGNLCRWPDVTGESVCRDEAGEDSRGSRGVARLLRTRSWRAVPGRLGPGRRRHLGAVGPVGAGGCAGPAGRWVRRGCGCAVRGSSSGRGAGGGASAEEQSKRDAAHREQRSQGSGTARARRGFPSKVVVRARESPEGIGAADPPVWRTFRSGGLLESRRELLVGSAFSTDGSLGVCWCGPGRGVEAVPAG